MDLRKTLYSNIVLSGGSTMFAGFGDRLLADVRKEFLEIFCNFQVCSLKKS